MPDSNTPPTVTNPDNTTELPESWSVYKPPAGMSIIEALQLDIAPRLAVGKASKAEIAYFDQHRPSHWEPASAWNAPADPAAQQQQPAQQQQQTAPATFNVATFDAHALAVASDEHSHRIVDDIAKLADSIDARAWGV